MVTNAAGCSAGNTINVPISNTAPAVTTDPLSQSVQSGTSVTFTAAASGSPTPNVQWQVSTGGPFTITFGLGRGLAYTDVNQLVSSNNNLLVQTTTNGTSPNAGGVQNPCAQLVPPEQATPTHAISTHWPAAHTWPAAQAVPPQAGVTQSPRSQFAADGHTTPRQSASTQAFDWQT